MLTLVMVPGVTVKSIDQLVFGLVTVPEQALGPVMIRARSTASLPALGMKLVQKSVPTVLCASTWFIPIKGSNMVKSKAKVRCVG